MRDLHVRDIDLFRDTCHEVTAMHRIIRWRILDLGKCRADFDLDLLRCSFTDENVVLAAHVFFDAACEFVTGDTDGFIADDSPECNNRNLRSTTAYVDDHIS